MAQSGSAGVIPNDGSSSCSPGSSVTSSAISIGVGASNSARMGRSMPSRSPSRATAAATIRELPPSSKKSSCGPTASRFSTCANVAWTRAIVDGARSECCAKASSKLLCRISGLGLSDGSSNSAPSAAGLSGDGIGPGAGWFSWRLTHPGGHLLQTRAAATYGWQAPLQFFEQHSELDPQDDPFDLQGWQVPPRQLPEQQVPVVQVSPISRQQPLTSVHVPL